MKIKVNVILGFLKAGKTSLINCFLQSNELVNEKVVIIQYENGESSIKIPKHQDAVVLQMNIKEDISDEFLKDIINKYLPTRIIIEYNGMGDCNNFIRNLQSHYFKKLFILDRVINVIDAHYAKLFLLNMNDRVLAHLSNSNLIIINNYDEKINLKFDDLLSFIKYNNHYAKIIKFNNLASIENSIYKRKLCLNYYNEKLSFKEIIRFISIFLFFVLFLSFASYITFTGQTSKAISMFNSFKINFMSIMIEGLPFILIGSFIAAIIQIFVPDTWIYKLLKKPKVISSFLASILGVIFPICDCGTIPLAFGFLNKGIPLNAVIAFMLAAPIVNPISIMSTMYAFPDRKEIVIIRVLLGVAIAIIASLILSIQKKEEVINPYTVGCDCELCNGTYTNVNLAYKIKGLFISTGDEFFRVSKYMIAGAIFSGIFQILNTDNLLGKLPEGRITYLLFMMIMAFLLSVCSTSDAFIAKGFLNLVPLNSILGFLVIGPMIDIKNTIMLTGYFKKNFILKYIITILLITFITLLFLPI